MVFNSFAFIFVFFPLTLAGFLLLKRQGRQGATVWLLLASLIFYGCWDYRFLPLLLASILFHFWAGQRIIGATTPLARKRWMQMAVSVNLLLLAFFKYTDFFIQSANTLTGAHFPLLKIALPVGISFFSFTQIAFLLDSYYGRISAVSLRPYLSFASYFPYIVSGPILNYNDMAPQLASPAATGAAGASPPRAAHLAAGLALFVCGLAKKILIADNLIPLVTPAFTDQNPQLIQVWVGLVAYSLQLYFDFSGYSDMAIGVSRMMGIELPLNFNSPYKATSVSDFWQRWHISLSRFLRNYLYIPLGGNRCGVFNRYRNLMLTMLLGGLWHGANWTFVIWGGLHGLYLCIQHGWQALRPRQPASPPPSASLRLLHRILTLLAVLVAWCFFRAPDVPTAFKVLSGLVGLNGVSWVVAYDFLPLFALAGGLFLSFGLPNSQEIFSCRSEECDPAGPQSACPRSLLPLRWFPNWQWGVATGFIFVLCVLNLNRVAGFIYVQF